LWLYDLAPPQLSPPLPLLSASLSFSVFLYVGGGGGRGAKSYARARKPGPPQIIQYPLVALSLLLDQNAPTTLGLYFYSSLFFYGVKPVKCKLPLTAQKPISAAAHCVSRIQISKNAHPLIFMHFVQCTVCMGKIRAY
jgi:hypothetical protein